MSTVGTMTTMQMYVLALTDEEPMNLTRPVKIF